MVVARDDVGTTTSSEPFVANDGAEAADAMTGVATPRPAQSKARPRDAEPAFAPTETPDGRPQPFSSRGLDPLRDRHAGAAQEMSTGEEMKRPNALRSRDGDGAGTSSADSSVSGVSGPTPVRAEAMTGDTAERASSEPPRRDAVDQVVTRLRELRTPGRHEISVRLDPPELGGVRIDARLEGARLHVHIRAEHALTGEMLTDALPRIRETLAQQGFAPGDVSVHLGLDGSGRHSARDSAPTFTPPRDHEPSPASRAVPVTAGAVSTTDGLELWA
jgi:hypothetical protein